MDINTPSAPRRAWVAPRIDALPPLTNLTLQTVSIPGDTDPNANFSY